MGFSATAPPWSCGTMTFPTFFRVPDMAGVVARRSPTSLAVGHKFVLSCHASKSRLTTRQDCPFLEVAWPFVLLWSVHVKHKDKADKFSLLRHTMRESLHGALIVQAPTLDATNLLPDPKWRNCDLSLVLAAQVSLHMMCGPGCPTSITIKARGWGNREGSPYSPLQFGNQEPRSECRSWRVGT